MRFVRAAVLVSIVVVHGSAGAATLELTAVLDAAQAVECGLTSSARGFGTFTLDDETGWLDYSITFGNNAPDFDDGNLALGAETGAHFHWAAPRGGIGYGAFALPLGPTKQGSVFLLDAFVGQVKAGLWYVDIHSDACPKGEIRGQLALPLGGEKIGVSVRKLVLDDKHDPGRVVYVSRDAAIEGVGTNASAIHGYLGATALSPDEWGTWFGIPAGPSDGTRGWVVKGSEIAKFVNKEAPDGPTGVKLAVVRPNISFKLVSKRLGDGAMSLTQLAPVGPPIIISTYVHLADGNGGRNYCSVFEAGSCRWGSAFKVVCKGGVPDPSCAALPASPSGAFVGE